MGHSLKPSASDLNRSPCFICAACHEVATVSYWLNDPEQLVSLKRWLEHHDIDGSKYIYSVPRFSPVAQP